MLNKRESQSPTVQLQDLAEPHVRLISAGNSNAPVQILTRLSEDVLHAVRQRVAENPRTPSAILESLAGDHHYDVRLAVAENPNTPESLLSKLAMDPCVDVRYGIAENPKMPMSIIQKLVEDENPYVSHRAAKTVEDLSRLARIPSLDSVRKRSH